MMASQPKEVTKENIVSWLHGHIKLTPDKQLTLNDICKAMNSNCTNHAVGRIIQKVFPNLIVKRKRCHEDWTLKCITYHGIDWRQIEPSNNFNFSDISQLSTDFFVIKQCDNNITLGHMVNFMINFNKVVIEVVFQKNLKWFLSICGTKRIKPHKFGMNDNFLLEKNNISGILDGICTLRTCQGLDAEIFTLKESEDEIIKEMFTVSNDENSTKKVFRAMNCHRIINFRNHPSANICSTCKSILKINKNKLMTCTKTSPLANITNSHGHTACTDTSKKVLNENVNTIPSSMTKLNKTVKVENIESKELHRTSDGGVPTCPIALLDAYGSKKNITLSNTTVHVSELPKSTLLPKHEAALPGLTVSDRDSSDIEVIFNEISKDCSPQILEFLMSQKKALSNHPNGRRWNANIIRLCLTLWCRSPKCYADLRDSGFLILPSQQILQIYKGRFHQKAGLNKELLHWMKNEAMHRNLPPEGYDGGLILDEMSIQSDLQFYSKNGKNHLVGFTDILDESQFMDSINSGKREIPLATHVPQFVYLGFTGFRFPLFHFPTKQATASELNVLFWKIVNLLLTFGFNVRYISMDGAQTNRDFIKILLGDFKSSSVTTMKVQNIFSLSPQFVYVIMDYSHIMKKIRNNLVKSGKQNTYQRHLLHNEHFIYWEHFKSAYMWDIANNPFPIHQKLSHEHFYLTSESKMRNKLAEDVLNKEMLHLVKTYASSLGENGSYLKGTIELLENTSILVENFRDHRPIREIGDERLCQNKNVLIRFQAWESFIQTKTDIKDKEKHMISHQTRADICSLLIGFNEMCKEKLKSGSSSIVPNRINSDVIENVFCQQRGLYNGNNTNPTYLNYCRTMNAVILGQTTISKKSNVGGITPGAAEPFSKYKFSSSTQK